jgi:hypothetical protein
MRGKDAREDTDHLPCGFDRSLSDFAERGHELGRDLLDGIEVSLSGGGKNSLAPAA